MLKNNSWKNAKYYYTEELGKSNYLNTYNNNIGNFINILMKIRWEIEVVELAVPMSPDEVLLKREAIFRHES